MEAPVPYACKAHGTAGRHCIACGRPFCEVCLAFDNCKSIPACSLIRARSLATIVSEYKSGKTEKAKFAELVQHCPTEISALAPILKFLPLTQQVVKKKHVPSKIDDAMSFETIGFVTEGLINLAVSGHSLDPVVFDKISVELAKLLRIQTPVKYETWDVKQLCFDEANEDKAQSEGTRKIEDIMASVYDYATIVVDTAEGIARDEGGPEPVRVHLMRDCFWPMICDNLVCIKRKKQPNCVGALISRRSFPEKFYDVDLKKIFDAAIEQKKTSRKKFDDFLLENINTMRRNDKIFATSCDSIVEHLRIIGALKFKGKEPIEQSIMFVDTGYKTFPVLLKAILASKFAEYGDRIKVSMLYHTVDPEFKFLPTAFGTEKKNIHISGMNDVGSYASFLKTGATMQKTGELTPETVGFGNPQRLYNSSLVGLMAVMKSHPTSDATGDGDGKSEKTVL